MGGWMSSAINADTKLSHSNRLASTPPPPTMESILAMLTDLTLRVSNLEKEVRAGGSQPASPQITTTVVSTPPASVMAAAPASVPVVANVQAIIADMTQAVYDGLMKSKSATYLANKVQKPGLMRIAQAGGLDSSGTCAELEGRIRAALGKA